MVWNWYLDAAGADIDSIGCFFFNLYSSYCFAGLRYGYCRTPLQTPSHSSLQQWASKHVTAVSLGEYKCLSLECFRVFVFVIFYCRSTFQHLLISSLKKINQVKKSEEWNKVIWPSQILRKPRNHKRIPQTCALKWRYWFAEISPKWCWKGQTYATRLHSIWKML